MLYGRSNFFASRESIGPEKDEFSRKASRQVSSDLKWADAPGNVLLTTQLTGLAKDSVANVSLIVALDRGQLTERVGKLPRRPFELLLAGIDIVLGR